MDEQREKSSPKSTLQSLLDGIRKAPDIKNLNGILRERILDAFHVEMASIFLVGKNKQELVSWLLIPGDSLEKIVVPIETNSIVGFTALKMKALNISNPYDFQELRRVGPELSFSDSYDVKANVRSKQILAVPLVHDNVLIGVLQLINTVNDTDFTYNDERGASDLAELLATIFFTHGNYRKQLPPQYEFLVSKQLLSRKQLEQGLRKAAERGEDPETVFIRDFQIPKRKLGTVTAEYYSAGYTDLETVDGNPEKLFPGIHIGYFKNKSLVPVSMDNGKLIVAAKSLEDQTLSDNIQEQFPKVKQVELMFAFQEDIQAFWARTDEEEKSSPAITREKVQDSVDSTIFDLLSESRPRREEVPKQQVKVVERVVEKVPGVESSGYIPRENSEDINDPQVVDLVTKIIERGYSTHASHIHIEPYGPKENGEVRYRIDGALSTPSRLPQQHMGKVIDRLKFLASLQRGERIRPQVGTFHFTPSRGKRLDLRMATIPTANGNEDIVLSLLPAPMLLLPLDRLMPSRLLPIFTEIIDQPRGIIFVVGPHASGKTTTLHAALAHLNSNERKIWTAEYPLEIQQRRVRQVQVDPVLEYTYADALRAILHADPDVIMISDLQDPQTAALAVDAALNGQLLLGTLPANSAAEGIRHCLTMGLDPAHLATALHGVLAQRLVRTLCDHCKEPYHPDRDEYDQLFESYGVSFFDHINIMYSDDLVFYRATGCPKCNNSGYYGKKGLYELLVITPAIRELIMKRAPLSEIIDEAMLNNMTLLLQEGIRLLFEGTTDHEELTAACSL